MRCDFERNTSLHIAPANSTGESERSCKGLASSPGGEFIIHRNRETDLMRSVWIGRELYSL